MAGGLAVKLFRLLMGGALLAGCAAGTVSTPLGSGSSPSVTASTPSTPVVSPTPTATDSTSVPGFAVGQELMPGTYTSKVFDTPVTFTVPKGWKVFEDEPGQFGLAILANDGPCICVWRDVRAMAASCAEQPEPGVGTRARDIADWLAHQKGIDASPVNPVSLGGLHGYVVDVAIDPAWTRPCPFSEGRPAVPTLVGSGISTGVAWDVEAMDRQRLYLLDLGTNGAAGNVAINIDVCCGVDWQQRIIDVTPVVESFQF
jgi:hypothetical protein